MKKFLQQFLLRIFFPALWRELQVARLTRGRRAPVSGALYDNTYETQYSMDDPFKQ